MAETLTAPNRKDFRDPHDFMRAEQEFREKAIVAQQEHNAAKEQERLRDRRLWSCTGAKRHDEFTKVRYSVKEIDAKDAAIAGEIEKLRARSDRYVDKCRELSERLLAIDLGKAKGDRKVVLQERALLDAELELTPEALGLLSGQRTALRVLKRLANCRHFEQQILELVIEREKKESGMAKITSDILRRAETQSIGVLNSEIESLQNRRLSEIGHSPLTQYEVENPSKWPVEATNVRSSTTAMEQRRVAELRGLQPA